MGLNLGVMSAAVVLDDSDYRRKLSGLEGASEGTFKRIAQLAAGYLSARALFGFVQGAMAEYSKLEEGNNKLKYTYTALGDEASRVAQTISTTYGLARQTATNAIADVGDLLTGLGFQQAAALSFARQVTERGIDVASYKGLDQTETIRRMTVALTGETEGLKSMGIVIRQGSEEFQNQVQSIMDATGATETMAKAQVILQEIMKQTANAEGDYLRPDAPRTYAQEMSDLKEAVKQFKAEIGNQVQPITQETVVKARELLQWYNKLTPSAKSFLNVTTAITAALLILNNTSFGKSIMNAKGASDADVQAQQAKAREEVIRAENQMTTAQMEKNLAEQNLALAENATAAAENAEEHARAALIKAQATGDTAAIASAQQALLQATKATTEAKLNEAKAAQTLREKNVALTTATERFSTLSRALPGLLTSIASSATIAGNMSIFMTGGFKAAALAVKGFFASLGPIGWAILAAAVAFEAISAAIDIYNGNLEENAQKAKEAADAAADASAKNAEYNTTQMDAMQRLQELQKYEQLNSAEKQEAIRLLEELGIEYDATGASIDDMISKQGAEKKSLAELIELRKEDLKQQRLATLQKQIEANQAAIDANDQKKVGALGEFGRRFISFNQWTGDAKNAEIDAENQKYYDANFKLRMELQRLKNDEQQVGETEEERNRKNAEAAKKMREELTKISEKEWKIKFDSASSDEQIDMLTAKMDEAFRELKRKGKFSSIEQFKTSDRSKMNAEELAVLKEIIDLEQQRANINKRITDERKRAADNLRATRENRDYQNADDAGKVSSLDKKIAEKRAELEKTAKGKDEKDYTREELELLNEIIKLEQQRADIRKRSANAFSTEKEAYAKMDADRQKKQYDQGVEREIEEAKKKGDTAGVNAIMQRELDRAKQAADLMRTQYEQALRDAEADGIMTEEEKKRLQEMRGKLQDALSDQDSWAAKLGNQEEQDKDVQKQTVAWSSELLNAQLGGMIEPQEATAKNTTRIMNIASSIEKKMKSSGEVLS